MLNGKLVWVDLEMTGLDPDKDVILEIATIVTDSQLEIIAEGPNLAVHQPESVLAGMDEWNRTHHGSSGLIDRVLASQVDTKGAERLTLEFLADHIKSGESPLCGNSIGQDRRFLVRHMPALHDFFHYRSVDVSTIKELAKRWYPGLTAFEKKESHLALADIRESIAELRHYRGRIFR